MGTTVRRLLSLATAPAPPLLRGLQLTRVRAMCMVLLTRDSTRGAGRAADVVACIVYTTSIIIHKDLQGPSVQVVAPCTAARATWPECILLYSIFQKSPRIVLVHFKINFGLSKLIVGICLILISSIYQV